MNKDLIDITLLDTMVTEMELIAFVDYAVSEGYKYICIPSARVEQVKNILGKDSINICVTIGFPFSHNSQESKIAEIECAARHGAVEVDIVPDFYEYINGSKPMFQYQLKELISVAKKNKLKTKIIIETSEWEMYDIYNLTNIVKRSGADFVKTSTGKTEKGAQVDDVRMMATIMPTKASGGIRTVEHVDLFVEAGATRLGIGFEACKKIWGDFDLLRG